MRKAKVSRWAGITAVIYIILLVIGFFTGPLAGENGAFVGSPLLKGLIRSCSYSSRFAALCSASAPANYKSGDISKAMNKQMAAMGSYVSFCFFCGQFQGLFNWTKLGTLLAIGGADLLQSAGFTGVPLSICFIFVPFRKHFHVIRFRKMGDFRADLRSDVHAPWLSSRLHTAALQTW